MSNKHVGNVKFVNMMRFILNPENVASAFGQVPSF